MKEQDALRARHTPTPWDLRSGEHGFDVLDANGNVVYDAMAQGEWLETWAFIVRAVNAHEELINCLRAVLDFQNFDSTALEERVKLILLKAEEKE